MKFALYTTVLIAALGALAFFQFPWWIVAPAGALAGFLFPQSAWKGYAAAFATGFALWYGVALVSDMANGQKLSNMIGTVFNGLKGAHLLGATGFMGGLLAGLGWLTGLFARQWLSPTLFQQKYGT